VAVLVEAISVIIRREAVERAYRAGWQGFVEDVPNATLCADDELARVGFMHPHEVEWFIDRLTARGLTFLSEGKCVDVAVVDQQRGPTMPCDWLEFGRFRFGNNDEQVSACWLFEGPRIAHGLHLKGTHFELATPPGWDFNNSLSARFTFLSNEQSEGRLQFLGRDELDGMTGTLTPRQVLLRALCADGTVRMSWAPDVMERPPPLADRRLVVDRFRGMLLGLAIGDALGNTSEGLLPHQRRIRYGEIRDYLPNRHASQRRIGLPSDDTQLAFWTLEHLLDHGGIEPNYLAGHYCSRRIFGIGRTMSAFAAAWRASRDWKKAAQRSAGNGALMRIASVLAPHLTGGGVNLWVDAALGTAVTHNDRAAIASSIAFVGMLAELMAMDSSPAPDWWVSTFVARARLIEGDDTYYEPRGGPLVGTWSGPLWRFVAEEVPPALGKSTGDAAARWYSGAYLLETVPTVLHLLARHAGEPEQAIVCAVNDTKDNDTIAAIVGAAVGALHGEAAFPRRWLDGLSGRVVADVDDRRVFDLLDEVARLYAT
jgi:ADP-ribosylglycohydrolase